MRAEFRNLPFSFFATFPKIQDFRIWHSENSCPLDLKKLFDRKKHFCTEHCAIQISHTFYLNNDRDSEKTQTPIFRVSHRLDQKVVQSDLHFVGENPKPRKSISGFCVFGDTNPHFRIPKMPFLDKKGSKNGIFGYTSKAD